MKDFYYYKKIIIEITIYIDISIYIFFRVKIEENFSERKIFCHVIVIKINKLNAQ